LELRLDNVLYRLGYGDSRAQSRQIVTHGHVLVNGRPLNIASAVLKSGDVVAIAEGSQAKKYFKDLAGLLRERRSPDWLQRNDGSFSAKVIGVPSRDQIDVSLNEQLIVEYYSR